MKLHLFNKKPSEAKLRKKIAKQFSANSKEYKIRMLEIDKQFNKISDEDFEYALLEINYHPDSTDYKLYKLDLDKKYNKISEYDYASKKLDLTMNHDTNDYKIAQVELKYKFGVINETQKEKEIATINNVPWFRFLDTNLDGENFSFAWDCNQPFLDAIAKMGYAQPDDEENVLEWLKDSFMKTYDEDIDVINKDIEEFEASKTIKTELEENPNIKIYS